MPIQVTLVRTHDQLFLILNIRHPKEVQIKATRCHMWINSNSRPNYPQTKDQCSRFRCRARPQLTMIKALLRVAQIDFLLGEWRHKWTIIAHLLSIWLWTTSVDMNFNMRAIMINTSSARVLPSTLEEGASVALDSIKLRLIVRLHLKMSNIIKWCIHADLRTISYQISSKSRWLSQKRKESRWMIGTVKSLTLMTKMTMLMSAIQSYSKIGTDRSIPSSIKKSGQSEKDST